ncbi:hypothetical protein AURDEDRAFT_159997 [Auricularia subglabra TFB-10046 SS5]|nr:hypothetical protein AURDEDRAFT_159997 [Auricularia subglabra TFB-10046 SS5]
MAHFHSHSRTHGEGCTIEHDGGHIEHKPTRVPPIRLPANKPITTLASLKEHLHAAMGLELSTIPLYLFGVYSIVQPDGVDGFPNEPARTILDVVIEEMLHLALSGNILRAVGGTPVAYGANVVPKYPSFMAGRVPPLPFELRQATQENISTFVQVELPEPKDAPPESDEYQTIGQFYAAITLGLQTLNASLPTLFDPDLLPYQFPQSAYKKSNSGGLVDVVDLTSATQAITTIVTQGEGNPRPWDDPEHDEKDHYDIFLDIFNSATLKWSTYPVLPNPSNEIYRKVAPDVYEVSRAFDAAYCYLLLTVQYLWQLKDGSERNAVVGTNLFGLMRGVLTPIAKFLVKQPLGRSSFVAAPCFEYFDFGRGAVTPLEQLTALVEAAVKLYPDATLLADAQKKVAALIPVPL